MKWSIAGCFVALACLTMAPGSAFAQCKVFDDLKAAEARASEAAAKLHDVKLPVDVEQKIARQIADQLLENPLLDPGEALRNAIDRLPLEDKLAATPWYLARQARDAADADAAKALADLAAAVNSKDAALKQAQAQYDEDVKHLDAEKAALNGMPRDEAYLDRILKLTDRLKKSYNKMLSDLQPHRNCFRDADIFAKDKEERLLRIDALEEKIAKLRGTNPPAKPGDAKTGDANTAAKPADGKPVDGEPAPPGPIGTDVYTVGQPEVSAARGKLTKVSADGFEFEMKKDDGTVVRAGVRIKKGPPATIRANERVEIIAEAYGDLPAFSYGNWELNNIVGGQIPDDNGCGSIDGYKGTPGSNSRVATAKFYFGANQYDASIRFYGGQYNSPDGTEMQIVWKIAKP